MLGFKLIPIHRAPNRGDLFSVSLELHLLAVVMIFAAIMARGIGLG
jgi:uncharacterized membrane protein